MPSFFRDTDLFKPRARNFMFGLNSNSIIHKVVDENEEDNNITKLSNTDSMESTSVDTRSEIDIAAEKDLNADNEGDTDNDFDATDGIGATGTSDDIQITDIKSVITEEETTTVNDSSTTTVTANSSIGSVDHLLKAIGELTHSRKTLESDLNKTNDQLMFATGEMKKKSEIIDASKDRIAKLNAKFTAINTDIVSFKKKTKLFDKNLGVVKGSVESIQKDLKYFSGLLNTYKGKIDNYKNSIHLLKVENEIFQTDITSKNLRIDDISGRLSEEKIKNHQMEKELSLVRSKYEHDLSDTINKNQTTLNSLIEVVNEKFDEFKTQTISVEQKLGGKCEEITLKHESLKSDIKDLFGLKDKSFFETWKEINSGIDEKFNSIIEGKSTDLKTQLESLNASVNSVKSNDKQNNELIQASLIAKFEKISNEINNQFNEIKISKDLNLKEISNDYRNLMNDFKTENGKLIALQSENKALRLINTSNLEKLDLLESKISTNLSQLSKLTFENTKLTDQLHLKNSTIADLKNEISKSNVKLVMNENKLKELKKSSKISSKRKLIGGSSSGASTTAANNDNNTTSKGATTKIQDSNSRKSTRKDATENHHSVDSADFELPDSSVDDIKPTFKSQPRKRVKKY